MKRLTALFLLALALLTGCAAPAATPTQIAAAPALRPPAAQAPAAAPTAAPAAPYSQQPYQQPEQPIAQATAAPWTHEYAPEPTYPENAENPPVYSQPAVDTRHDHLSTFGLDVDTASYTQARQQLQNGQQPAANTVRAEEFINYFKQDYPTPQGVAFGIYADGAPNPYEDAASHLLRIGIQGYQEDSERRKPRNLTFVIDASGSMGDSGKLDLVKQTLNLLLTRMGSSDSIAVVAYSTNAWVVVNPTSAQNRDWVNQQIQNIWPTNTTNLAQGLELGYQLADQAFNRNSVNRVILCTDGVANTGATDASTILDRVHEYAGRDITLTALGVGMGDYNDTLLEQLADKGNGNYAYIDDLDEARNLFIDKLAATLDVIAMNAKVQVDFNPDVVTTYRQIGYEDRAIADQDFRNDSVDAGEIGAGHSVTALYAVSLKPGATGRIATVQLRWEDPTSHQVSEINGNFNTWDMSSSFESASPRFQQDVVAGYFAGLLRGSTWSYSAGWDQLYNQAWKVSRQLYNDSDVQELVSLISQARTVVGR
jgi:Ca-activated chloride channel family protein